MAKARHSAKIDMKIWHDSDSILGFVLFVLQATMYLVGCFLSRRHRYNFCSGFLNPTSMLLHVDEGDTSVTFSYQLTWSFVLIELPDIIDLSIQVSGGHITKPSIWNIQFFIPLCSTQPDAGPESVILESSVKPVQVCHGVSGSWIFCQTKPSLSLTFDWGCWYSF